MTQGRFFDVLDDTAEMLTRKVPVDDSSTAPLSSLRLNAQLVGCTDLDLDLIALGDAFSGAGASFCDRRCQNSLGLGWCQALSLGPEKNASPRKPGSASQNTEMR